MAFLGKKEIVDFRVSLVQKGLLVVKANAECQENRDSPGHLENQGKKEKGDQQAQLVKPDLKVLQEREGQSVHRAFRVSLAQ